MIALDADEAENQEYSEARREVLPPPSYCDEVEACLFNLVSGILYDIENAQYWSEEFAASITMTCFCITFFIFSFGPKPPTLKEQLQVAKDFIEHKVYILL